MMQRIWKRIQHYTAMTFCFVVLVVLINAIFTPQANLVGFWKF